MEWSEMGTPVHFSFRSILVRMCSLQPTEDGHQTLTGNRYSIFFYVLDFSLLTQLNTARR